MFQPRLNLRPPITAYADAATLALLAEVAKAFMDSADQDFDDVRKRERDVGAKEELERLANEKVAKAPKLLNLHNALEDLLPAEVPAGSTSMA